MIRKSNYETPITEVMEIQAEGVLCESIPGFGEGSFEDYDDINW